MKNTNLLFFQKLCILLTLVSTIACSSETPKEQQAPTEENIPALEFDPKLSWLNVKRPLSLQDLRGKVVILDFWTYGCVNCIHVLADLRKLEQKYGTQLAVIGVHSPKFDNEKNLETLRKIVVRYDIEHPVVHDVEFVLGNFYGMRAWPTQVVINPEGFIVGGVRGEGHYELLDRVIADLVLKHASMMDTSPLPLDLEKNRLGDFLLAAPGKIAVSQTYIAISDALRHRVVLTDHKGKIKTIYGGDEAGLRDGNARKVRFSSPQGLVFADHGLYVADTGNHAIRYIELSTGQVKTIAGNGDDKPVWTGQFDALSISLRSPWGLTIKNTELYIAMAGMHQIWRLDLTTGKIGPFAGSGREGITDGPINRAEFSQPSGLSIAENWLYVADAEDSAVRRIHLLDKRVETLVGRGLFDFGDLDGSFETAKLQHVLGVAVLNDSKVIVADTYNHKLKLLDLSGRKVTTIAGTGQPGNSLGKALESMLNEPGGLTTFNNRVLVADTNNHRIVEYDFDSKSLKEWNLSF